MSLTLAQWYYVVICGNIHAYILHMLATFPHYLKMYWLQK